MTVEHNQFETAAEAEPEKASAPARLRVSPPPLAPDAPQAPKRRSLGRRALVAALLSLAGIAHLTGSSLIVTGGLLLISFAALVMQILELRKENRLTSLLDENVSRSREEIENLADRMWELQESEERFHGLIDALGDIVVHRDREGRIVYANRVLSDMLGCKPDAFSWVASFWNSASTSAWCRTAPLPTVSA
jgi:PAS domain-containing protein